MDDRYFENPEILSGVALQEHLDRMPLKRADQDSIVYKVANFLAGKFGCEMEFLGPDDGCVVEFTVLDPKDYDSVFVLAREISATFNVGVRTDLSSQA